MPLVPYGLLLITRAALCRADPTVPRPALAEGANKLTWVKTAVITVTAPVQSAVSAFSGLDMTAFDVLHKDACIVSRVCQDVSDVLPHSVRGSDKDFVDLTLLLA